MRRPLQTSSQNGFSLVEVVVVLVIIAILAALSMRALQSPSKTLSERTARSAAQAYVDGIERFRKDHGGRPPVMNTSDWPAPTVNGPARLDGTSYLDGGRPETMARGKAWFGAPTQSAWGLTYEVVSAQNGAAIAETDPSATYRFTLTPPVGSSSSRTRCEMLGAPGAGRPNVRDCG